MSEHEVIEANRASELLRKLGRGGVDIRFAEKIREVTDAVTAHGGKGEVTVKIVIEKNKSQDIGGVVMNPSVNCKVPEAPIGTTTMQVGDDGAILTQQEFLLFGGPSERPRVEVASEHDYQRARAESADAPKPAAPIADSPKPAPLADADDDDEDDEA